MVISLAMSCLVKTTHYQPIADVGGADIAGPGTSTEAPSSQLRYLWCFGTSSRYAYTRTLTSGRITITFHDLEEASTVVEINTRVDPGALEGRQRHARARSPSSAPRPRDRLAERVLDHSGERPARLRGERLCLTKEIVIEPNGGSHASQDTSRVGCP